MCHKIGMQNEYEFHFTGAKGKYGMARRKKDNAQYECKDIAVWGEKEKKGKEHNKEHNPTKINVICGSCWQCSGESVVATTTICRMQKGWITARGFQKSSWDNSLHSQLYGGQYLKQFLSSDVGREGASDLYLLSWELPLVECFLCAPESCCHRLGAATPGGFSQEHASILPVL